MNILLVEDDLSIGRLVARGLKGRGYQVTWERRGSSVTALLASGKFVAAVLDLGLPDCDGLDLCRSLRDAAMLTPVLMLTARGELQDKLDGFEAGADDYLSKPFAFEELAARLAVLIKRHPATATSIKYGNLVLHSRTRTASVDDDPLRLSRREYDLLERLILGEGKFVPRSELLDAVWEDTPTNNALDVYIRLLRRRLAEHPNAPLIITRRGAGCRLAPPEEALG